MRQIIRTESAIVHASRELRESRTRFNRSRYPLANRYAKRRMRRAMRRLSRMIVRTEA